MKTIYLSLLSIPLLSSCTSTDVQDPEDPLPCDPLAADPSDPSACEPPPDAPTSDSLVDVMLPEGSSMLSADSGELTTASGEKLMLPRSKSESSTLHFIHANNFYVPRGATLLVTGNVPSQIVINGAMTIEGNIKVEAGRNAANCGASKDHRSSAGLRGAAVGVSTRAGGGGGGGALDAAGGGGGTGFGDRPGGAGGVRRSGLMAGCPGGKGGDNTDLGGQQGGAGGVGGGALVIRAAKIKVTGQIIANGAGGGAGTKRGGGGGGGSGGMIVLDGNDVELGGAVPLCANGGGGGEAGQQGGPGVDGQDGRCSDEAAKGGRSSGAGGNGGNGGVRGALAGRRGGNGTRSSTGLEGGGGGGGGGVGRILIRARNNFVVQPRTVTSPNFDRRQ